MTCNGRQTGMVDVAILNRNHQSNKRTGQAVKNHLWVMVTQILKRKKNTAMKDFSFCFFFFGANARVSNSCIAEGQSLGHQQPLSPYF